MCCCVRSEDTLKYNTPHHEPVASGFAYTQSARRYGICCFYGTRKINTVVTSVPLVPVLRHVTAIHTPSYAYAF